MTNTRFGVVLMTVLASALPACKVETLQDPDDLAEQTPPWRLGSLPHLAERGAELDPTVQWAASVRKHLSFLSGADLRGRRPGTEGGRVTAAAAEALFEGAGLVPSAGNFGWTTPVPIRVVSTKDVSLTFRDPADPTAQDITIKDGLWVHHRGAAGAFSLPLKPTDLSDTVPPTGTLALGARNGASTGDAVGSAADTFRGSFDAAHHRGATVCLLELPGASEVLSLQAAQGWAAPEVQSIELDRDPPSGLALEGFAAPGLFSALERVATVADGSVVVNFVAEERWFEDKTVVGRVVGRSRPEQVVIVTANWDAGGLEPPVPEGSAALAATGPAALFALVERVGLLLGTGLRPERSIVFVAAAGGSLGNLGLGRLAAAGIAIPENIVAIIHLDHLDWTAPTQTVVGGTQSTLGAMFLAFQPSTQLVDAVGRPPFEMPGVPTITLTRRGGMGDSQFDSSTPLVNLVASTRVAFDVVWELANAAQFPELVESGRTEVVPAPSVAPAPLPAPSPAPLPSRAPVPEAPAVGRADPAKPNPPDPDAAGPDPADPDPSDPDPAQ